MQKRTIQFKIYLLAIVSTASAFGPFVIDFYLPALPSIGEYFSASTSLVQLSLTSCIVGLAFGQLIIGPLSDKYGRKRPLMLSLLLFVCATVGCIYAPNIGIFFCARFIQGLSSSGGVTISKSIVIDLYEEKELTGFFSLLSAVQSLAPVLAPVLGGILMEITNWKGIFLALIGLGLLLMIALTFFRESLGRNSRLRTGVFSTFRQYGPVLKNRLFMRYTLIQTFMMAAFFAYIAVSPFLLQEHFRLSSLEYALCFGGNAMGLMLGSLAVARFSDTDRALRTGLIGSLVMSIVVGVCIVCSFPFWTVETVLFLFMAFLGMVQPASTVLALSLERSNSGSASALLGFLSFLAGGLVSPLTGMGNMLYTSSMIMVSCNIGAYLCSHKLPLK